MTKKKNKAGGFSVRTRALSCTIACLEQLVELAKLAKYYLVRQVDVIWHRARPRKPAVLQRMTGAVVPGTRKKLCVFAHFDRDGLVEDYVTYYLSKIEELGCEIIFVSAAEGMEAAQIEKVRPYCSTIIIRENQGHDFGSWKTGLAAAGDLSRYDRLVIANDSVYGPFFDLGVVFDGVGPGDAGFWGITDSRRFGHHLQSYFLVFGRSILKNSAFEAFWRRLPYYRFKHSVILGGEVELSRLLAREGFNFRALCPHDKVWKRHLEEQSLSGGRRQPSSRVDTTHWGWETLLRDFKCPFLKVRLLRDNRKNLLGTGRWDEVVSQCSNYDTAMIRRHLNRFGASAQG